MNRRIVAATAVAAVVVLAAWFVALWQPKGEELGLERQRLELARSEAESLEARIARLRSIQKDAPLLTARLDRLRSAVPDEPNLAQFILDANDAATDSGVSFVSITPAEPAPSTVAGLPPEIGLGVEIEGGYFQVLDFAEKLGDLDRVVVIDGVNAAPNGTDAASTSLSVSLQARMFTTQLPPLPAAEAPAPASTPSTPVTTTSTVVPS